MSLNVDNSDGDGTNSISGEEDEFDIEEGTAAPPVFSDEQSPPPDQEQQDDNTTATALTCSHETEKEDTQTLKHHSIEDEATCQQPTPELVIALPEDECEGTRKNGTATHRQKELQLAPPMEPGALKEAHAASLPVTPSSAVAVDNHQPTNGSPLGAVVQPGAVRVRGIHWPIRGRNHSVLEAEEERTMMPIAAEVVEEAPDVVVAMPAPPEQEPSWWTKPRHRRTFIAFVVALTIGLTVLVTVLVIPVPAPLTNSGNYSEPTPAPTNSTSAPTRTQNPLQSTNSTPDPEPPTPEPSVAPTLSGLWKQMGQDIDGERAEDLSGYSVSLSANGTMIAIGAYENDGNGHSSGHVRLYHFNGTEWFQVGTDINGEDSYDFSGYSVSLSGDGTSVAIGAIHNAGNGIDAGHVRLFQLNGTVWNQVGSDLDGEAAGDQFGYSVSLSADGTTVAVGAPYNDNHGTEAGSARVYRLNNSEWIQLGSSINGKRDFDWFGYAVSLSANGMAVAIGAPGNDGSGSELYAGHVRVYHFDGTEWIQVGDDLDGEAAGDRSGSSVSLSADGMTVAIGAYWNNDGGSQSGHVCAYHFNETDWDQVGNDMYGKAPGDHSGSKNSISLSADGTNVAIGARHNNGNGTRSGHVRVFRAEQGDWIQVGMDLEGEAAGDRSGSVSLSANGTIVAIGAHKNNGKGADSGHVRVYQLEEQ